MRVFVTGGSGYIGSAVVAGLIEAGYHVSGLARSEDSAEALRHLGAEPVLGDVAGSRFRDVAAEHQVLIHMAANHGPDVASSDRHVVDSFLSAAEDGVVDHIIYTSGVWVLGNTGAEPAYEDASTDGALPKVAWRPPHERLVLDAATPNLATTVVRPGMVYGEKRGLVSPFFETARRDHAARFVGGGDNRWSFVHRGDLAEYYCLLVARRAQGLFHAVDGTPLRVADAARAASVAAGADGATTASPAEQEREKIGALADALCLDQQVLSRRDAELGWTPTYSSFVAGADAAYREYVSRDFAAVYSGKNSPPWEIGRPQRALVELEAAGKVGGDVLDVACGTGENTLFFARRGHQAWGVDITAGAIEEARRKASERGIAASFQIGDALGLEELGRKFDTIVDSGLFHIFDPGERRRYAESLAAALSEGGAVYILCFRDDEPGQWGPRRVARSEFADTFADGWSVESVEEVTFEHFQRPQGSPAWLAMVRRVR